VPRTRGCLEPAHIVTERARQVAEKMVDGTDLLAGLVDVVA
jgi:hypothetical protein